MPEIPPVIQASEKYLNQLASLDTAAIDRLVRAWGGSYKRLALLLDNLLLEIGDNPITRGQLVRLERYKTLMTQVGNELLGLQGLTSTEVEQALSVGVNLGLKHSIELLSVTVAGNTSVTGAFNTLPVNAVKQMIGFLSPDSVLFKRLQLIAPTTANWVSQSLIQGMALGKNPRVVAASFREAFGRGLTDAARFARTAQLWAYREASRANYVANEKYLGGWIWCSALSDRTCVACLAMHGTEHPTWERLNDHHNGRCRQLPIVRGYPSPLEGLEASGEKWFGEQPVGIQQKIMGREYWQAWKDGAYKFDELVGTYKDEVYGEMRHVKPLWQLLGTEPPLKTK